MPPARQTPLDRPLLALLTDFGEADYYVAAMKGVILEICPEVRLVDLAHGVRRHDVAAGAVVLRGCYREFPAGTVFCVVVDPGVGTERRAVLVDAGPYRFVAPDNGVLSFVLAREEIRATADLAGCPFRREPVHPTFHGRDLFAPAAAHAALGKEAAVFGAPTRELQRLTLGARRKPDGTWLGQVLHVDGFGNLITDIEVEDLGTDRWWVEVGDRQVRCWVRTYGDAERGEPVTLAGSAGLVEVACREESAAALLQAGPGTAVHLHPVPTSEDDDG